MITLAHDNLPRPEALVTNVDKVTMISPKIQLSIERIAQFVVKVRKRKLFLRSNTSFDELIQYHANNRQIPQRIYETAAAGKEHSPRGQDHKIYPFTVPIFDGACLDRQE